MSDSLNSPTSLYISAIVKCFIDAYILSTSIPVSDPNYFPSFPNSQSDIEQFSESEPIVSPIYSSQNLNNFEHASAFDSVERASALCSTSSVDSGSFRDHSDLIQRYKMVLDVKLDPILIHSINNICHNITTRDRNGIGDLSRLISPSRSEQPLTSSNNSNNMDTSFIFNKPAYFKVLDEVFRQKTSWGRIIMMFVYTSMLVDHSVAKLRSFFVSPQNSQSSSISSDSSLRHAVVSDLPGPILDVVNSANSDGHLGLNNESYEDIKIAYTQRYINWATEYLNNNKLCWVRENGGWDSLKDYDADNWFPEGLILPNSNFFLFGGLVVLGGILFYFVAKGRDKFL